MVEGDLAAAGEDPDPGPGGVVQCGGELRVDMGGRAEPPRVTPLDDEEDRRLPPLPRGELQ